MFVSSYPVHWTNGWIALVKVAFAASSFYCRCPDEKVLLIYYTEIDGIFLVEGFAVGLNIKL